MLFCSISFAHHCSSFVLFYRRREAAAQKEAMQARSARAKSKETAKRPSLSPNRPSTHRLPMLLVEGLNLQVRASRRTRTSPSRPLIHHLRMRRGPLRVSDRNQHHRKDNRQHLRQQQQQPARTPLQPRQKRLLQAILPLTLLSHPLTHLPSRLLSRTIAHPHTVTRSLQVTRLV